MNIIKYLLGLCIILAACSKEEDSFQSSTPIEITLSGSVSPTRVTSLQEQSEHIIEGQDLGVTIVGASAPHQNVQWTAVSEGKLKNTENEVYYSDGNATIYAYQPYNSLWNNLDQSYTFSVQEDQSTTKGYADSDLLWAQTTSGVSDQAVNLNFSHLMAKVCIVLTGKNGTDVHNADIALEGVELSAKFQQGTVTAMTGNTGCILAAKKSDTAAVVVAPQKLVPGQSFVVVSLGEKIFKYDLCTPTTTEFLSDYKYSYNLNLDATK